MAKVEVLDETAVLEQLDRGRVLDALENAFAGLISGMSVQPNQTVTVFPNGQGDCIFYPGALLQPGFVGVKVSPYLQGLADAGLYPVTAYTLLLSTEDGRPVLVCDSYALTSIRTAATTALALKYLAADTSTVLAVIGTGKVGREHLAYALAMRPWSNIRVYSPSAAQSGQRQDEVRRIAGDQEVTFSATCEAAVKGADVVLLCTSSGTPVIDHSWIAPRALVTSISTNSPGAHEIDPATLDQFDVFCDYRATAPTTAGEMKIAIEATTWAESSIVADLPELANGFVVAQNDRPKFFRSTGLGIEDLAIAGLLVK